MLTPQAVIFDCDGVLVDSEPVCNRLLAEFLTGLGLPHTLEDCYREYVGHNAEAVAGMLSPRLGRDILPLMRSDLRPRVRLAMETELRAVPGVPETLARLKLPRATASNSSPDYIRFALEKTGLLAYFGGHLYSARDVALPKPAPDVYLLAAARLGVAPARCVVVEDSIAGVRAGVAAGMSVVGFTGGSHCRAGHAGALVEAEAGRVIGAMSDLLEIVAGRVSRIVGAG